MKKSKSLNRSIFDPTQKLIYMMALQRRAYEEKSNFAKLIFQENLVSAEIVATIRALSNLTYRPISNKELKSIEKGTLGSQRDALYRYFHTYEVGIDYKLELVTFITLRNKLTHKMFCDFKDMESLEHACSAVTLKGSSLIMKVNEFRQKMFSRFLDGIIGSA